MISDERLKEFDRLIDEAGPCLSLEYWKIRALVEEVRRLKEGVRDVLPGLYNFSSRFCVCTVCFGRSPRSGLHIATKEQVVHEEGCPVPDLEARTRE